jgi:hypothetical protein
MNGWPVLAEFAAGMCGAVAYVIAAIASAFVNVPLKALANCFNALGDGLDKRL